MTAALQGESQYPLRAPILFTPIIPRIISSGEEAALKQMASVDRTGVERLVTSISSHHMDADVNTLLHLHHTSQQFESKRNGVTIGLIAASMVLILFILYYFTQAYLWNVVKSCAVKRENTESESVQKSQCNSPPLPPFAIQCQWGNQGVVSRNSSKILCLFYANCLSHVFFFVLQLVCVTCNLMFCFTAVMTDNNYWLKGWW
jgi:hypothetical protein